MLRLAARRRRDEVPVADVADTHWLGASTERVPVRGAALTKDHAALSAMVLAHGQTKLAPALRTVRCLLVADPPRLTRRVGLGALFERSDTGIADAHRGIPAEMRQRRQILAARRAHGMTAGMAIEKLPLFLFADGAH